MTNRLELDSLTPEQLRRNRTSVKWQTYDDDVLPLFIAETDFPLSPEIKRAVIEQVERDDAGYVNGPGELATAFRDFARDRWGWNPDPASITLAADVSFAIKETLRHVLPREGARVALTTPVYPSFFQYLVELGVECVEIPLTGDGINARIDTEALSRAFAGDGMAQVHAMILCNPHNPHGIAPRRDDLEKLARVAAETGAFIVSDEVHAPLTHEETEFVPFSPIAEAAGAQSLSVFSASKGWNLAGLKCAHIYAPPTTTSQSLRAHLVRSLGFSASTLGLTANIVAFRDSRDWIDLVIEQVRENAALLADLLAKHVPGAVYTPPRAGYLAWVDLRKSGLGEDPWTLILDQARVAVSDGATFGAAGRGGVRINLGCSPTLLREAIARIGAIIPAR